MAAARLAAVCKTVVPAAERRPYLVHRAAAVATEVPRRYLHATFNYCAGPAAEVLVTNPFEGDGFERCVNAGGILSVEHQVLDGRCEAELTDEAGASLHDRGFTLQRHASQVRDFNDAEEVRRVYYPELLSMAARLTGATRMVVASHVLRRSGAKKTNPGEGAVRGGAFFVHNDFCDVLKSQFEDMAAERKPSIVSEPPLSLSEAELRAGRLVVLNFWRPLNPGPLKRAPLAVCCAQSMQRKDLHEYAHAPKDLPPVYTLPFPIMLTLPESDPKHVWYYFSSMLREECMVIKTHDSSAQIPDNGVAVHSAFDLPDTAEDEPPRESIEARVICFMQQ